MERRIMSTAPRDNGADEFKTEISGKMPRVGAPITRSRKERPVSEASLRRGQGVARRCAEIVSFGIVSAYKSGMSELLLETLPTPLGPMLLVTDEAGNARAAEWEDCQARMLGPLRRRYGIELAQLGRRRTPSDARRALEAYFAGRLDAIDGVRVRAGGTSFQRDVWAALRAIPAGQAVTYATLASRLGRAKAVRAVGTANGANPVSVIVPCHRVVGSDGSLTGYGGGIERKRWLLGHEGALPDQSRGSPGSIQPMWPSVRR